jgi:uncharacterized protein (DUF1919 family)
MLREKLAAAKHKLVLQRKQSLANAYTKQLSNINRYDFTIISANCWGGSIYADLGIQYQTPTVGLFFYAPCFLRFIENLELVLKNELTFSLVSKYPEANIFRETNTKYPIGVLNHDIEIHFLHYDNAEDAAKKWERRKQRINYRNLFIAATDRDLMTPQLMQEYNSLSFTKKILFSSKKHADLDSVVWIKSFRNQPCVADLYTNRTVVTKYFRLDKWINE